MNRSRFIMHNNSYLSVPALRPLSRQTNRGLPFLIAFALAAALPRGQTLSLSPTTPSYDLTTKRNMVRVGTFLYAAMVEAGGAVRIWRKPDNPSSPWATWVAACNNSASGIGGTVPASSAALASTSDGTLHLTWLQGNYTLNYYKQWYVAVATATGQALLPPLDLTAAVGATTTRKTDSLAITSVGPGGMVQPSDERVYLTVQGSQNWHNQLLRLRAPWSAPIRTLLGNLSANGGSTQMASLATSFLTVHAVFYSNSPIASLSHRSFATGLVAIPGPWSPQTDICVSASGTPPPYSGALSTDAQGGIHVLFHHRTSATLSELRYLSFTGAAPPSGFTTTAVYTPPTGTNLDHAFDVVAQADGTVFATYRDGGRVIVNRKRPTASTFERLGELWPQSMAADDHGLPRLRGTVWPIDNRIGCSLDATCQRRSPTVAGTWHIRFDVCALDVDTATCPPQPVLFFAGSATAPGPLVIGVEGAPANALGVLMVGFTPSSVPIELCRNRVCHLLLQPVLYNQTGWVIAGTARTSLGFQPLPAPVPVYFQWAFLEPTCVHLSNRGRAVLH
jgi:hypothetical protein